MAGYRRRKKGAHEYWELTWRDSGHTHTQSLGRVDRLREPEVRTIAHRKSRERLIAEHATLKPQQSFAHYAKHYLEWHAAEYPASHWRVAFIVERHLLAHFGGTLEGIAQIDVERYKHARLAQQSAPGTVTKEMRTLAAMLNRAINLGLISRSPCALVRAPKSLNQSGIRFFTTADMTAIAAACIEPWHKFAWMLYAGTGARRMEGLNLKWSQIGGEEIKIISTGEERTKSGLARALPLSLGAQEALEFFRTWANRSDLYVLPRIAPPSISRAAAKCIRRAKLTGSLHTFRHTFISKLAMDPRVPVLAIKEWAGHSTLAVTEKYMHLRPSATDEILKGMRI